MSTLSAFKNSIKTALKVPHNGYKPRSRRQVISFSEALENLKTSETGSVPCAAFHTFGRCRKEITLLDSNFLANLDELDLTDIQAPIKLMPLMLCSTHWGKTVYHNALFLDWLSVYGSKQDHPHFENTVVDYQSAILIDNEENAFPNVVVSSRSGPDNQGRPVSAPSSSTKDENFPNDLNGVAQVQINSDYEKSNPPRPEPDRGAHNLPEISVLVGMEAYASIELGVATLEIMYQEHLKCIAMTSDGWRCPAVIQKERLLTAQELISTYATSGLEHDIKLLPILVLCPGHAIGDLPQIYSEKWAVFSGQRLSKEEAMSKFNAEFWESVQFFSNDVKDDAIRQTTSLNRPRSTSNLSSSWEDKHNFKSRKNAERKFLSPQTRKPRAPHTSLDSQTQKFEFTNPRPLFKPEVGTMLSDEDLLERASSSSELQNMIKSQMLNPPDHTADYLSTKHKPQSVRVPVFFNMLRKDESVQSEDTASSVSEELIEKAIPQEQNTMAQDSQPETHTISPSSYGATQQTNLIHSQDAIHMELIKEMNSLSIPEGYVHIFKSPHRKLFKIGKAAGITLREKQVQEGCDLQNFDQVPVIAISAMFPKRVIKLVHLELQDFRAKLSCEDHHHPMHSNEEVRSEHGEWFDVTEHVAIRSILLWSDLTNRAYNFDGSIKEAWAKKLTLLPMPDSTEVSLLEKVLGGENGDDDGHDVSSYHKTRNTRYEDWIAKSEA